MTSSVPTVAPTPPPPPLRAFDCIHYYDLPTHCYLLGTHTHHRSRNARAQQQHNSNNNNNNSDSSSRDGEAARYALLVFTKTDAAAARVRGGALPLHVRVISNAMSRSEADCFVATLRVDRRLRGGVACGVLGAIRFTAGYYLVLVTERRRVARVVGQSIYEVANVVVLSLHMDAKATAAATATTAATATAYTHDTQQRDERGRAAAAAATEAYYRAQLQERYLSQHYYYAHAYDVTHTLQTNLTSRMSMTGARDDNDDDDATTTASACSPRMRFVWNEYMLEPFEAHRCVSRNANSSGNSSDNSSNEAQQKQQQQQQQEDDIDDDDDACAARSAAHAGRRPCFAGAPDLAVSPELRRWLVYCIHGAVVQRRVRILVATTSTTSSSSTAATATSTRAGMCAPVTTTTATSAEVSLPSAAPAAPPAAPAAAVTARVTLTLFARASKEFAGPRYLRRGVNAEGNVANFVEVEQIVSVDDTARSHTTTTTTTTGAAAAALSSSRCVHHSAFVQVRGSVPVRWYHAPRTMTLPRPAIQLDMHDMWHSSTRRHFQQLLSDYGAPVLVMDLLKQQCRAHAAPRPDRNDNSNTSASRRREREAALGEAYRAALFVLRHAPALHTTTGSTDAAACTSCAERAVSACTPAVAGDASTDATMSRTRTAAAPPLRDCMTCHTLRAHDVLHYRALDMRAAAARAWNAVTAAAEDDVARVGFFVGTTTTTTRRHRRRWCVCRVVTTTTTATRQRQCGVVRTNCVDCVDRTNICQLLYGLHALGQQLHALGVVRNATDVAFLVNNSNSNSNNNSGGGEACVVLQDVLLQLYLAAGDAIARQYGGSAQVSAGVLHRGAVWDSLMHVTRFYHNALHDVATQTMLNVLLGRLQPQPRPGSRACNARMHAPRRLHTRALLLLLQQQQQQQQTSQGRSEDAVHGGSSSSSSAGGVVELTVRSTRATHHDNNNNNESSSSSSSGSNSDDDDAVLSPHYADEAVVASDTSSSNDSARAGDTSAARHDDMDDSTMTTVADVATSMSSSRQQQRVVQPSVMHTLWTRYVTGLPRLHADDSNNNSNDATATTTVYARTAARPRHTIDSNNDDNSDSLLGCAANEAADYYLHVKHAPSRVQPHALRGWWQRALMWWATQQQQQQQQQLRICCDGDSDKKAAVTVACHAYSDDDDDDSSSSRTSAAEDDDNKTTTATTMTTLTVCDVLYEVTTTQANATTTSTTMTAADELHAHRSTAVSAHVVHDEEDDDNTHCTATTTMSCALPLTRMRALFGDAAVRLLFASARRRRQQHTTANTTTTMTTAAAAAERDIVVYAHDHAAFPRQVASSVYVRSAHAAAVRACRPIRDDNDDDADDDNSRGAAAAAAANVDTDTVNDEDDIDAVCRAWCRSAELRSDDDVTAALAVDDNDADADDVSAVRAADVDDTPYTSVASPPTALLLLPSMTDVTLLLRQMSDEHDGVPRAAVLRYCIADNGSSNEGNGADTTAANNNNNSSSGGRVVPRALVYDNCFSLATLHSWLQRHYCARKNNNDDSNTNDNDDEHRHTLRRRAVQLTRWLLAAALVVPVLRAPSSRVYGNSMRYRLACTLPRHVLNASNGDDSDKGAHTTASTSLRWCVTHIEAMARVALHLVALVVRGGDGGVCDVNDTAHSIRDNNNNNMSTASAAAVAAAALSTTSSSSTLTRTTTLSVSAKLLLYRLHHMSLQLRHVDVCALLASANDAAAAAAAAADEAGHSDNDGDDVYACRESWGAVACVVNLYNALYVHAWTHIVYMTQSSSSPPQQQQRAACDVVTFYETYGYMMGTQFVSLSALKHGMLRCDRPPPYTCVPPSCTGVYTTVLQRAAASSLSWLQPQPAQHAMRQTWHVDSVSDALSCALVYSDVHHSSHVALDASATSQSRAEGSAQALYTAVAAWRADNDAAAGTVLSEKVTLPRVRVLLALLDAYLSPPGCVDDDDVTSYTWQSSDKSDDVNDGEACECCCSCCGGGEEEEAAAWTMYASPPGKSADDAWSWPRLRVPRWRWVEATAATSTLRHGGVFFRRAHASQQSHASDAATVTTTTTTRVAVDHLCTVLLCSDHVDERLRDVADDYTDSVRAVAAAQRQQHTASLRVLLQPLLLLLDCGGSGCDTTQTTKKSAAARCGDVLQLLLRAQATAAALRVAHDAVAASLAI